MQRWLDSLSRRRKGARDRLLHDDSPRAPGRQFTAVPYSVEYQGELARAAALLREAADLTAQPTLKRFLTTRADAFLNERLLRQRRGLDGARRVHRADHRPLRGVRGRVVQRQGGVRGVHHGPRRGGVEEAAVLLRAPAGARERAADRSRSTAIRSSARSRPSASSTSSSPPATPTAACRPPPSTCPTTSASSRRRAPSASC